MTKIITRDEAGILNYSFIMYNNSLINHELNPSITVQITNSHLSMFDPAIDDEFYIELIDLEDMLELVIYKVKD